MKRGIPFSRQQIEAYQKGATMFVAPIEEDIKGLHFHGFALGSLWFSNDKSNTPLELANGYKAGIPIEIPLQKGDEFFIQEEFKYVGCKAENSPMSSYSRIVYSDNINYNNLGLATGKTKATDASQMQEHQSRFKDVCLDVEIKRVQNISHNTSEIYAIYPEAHKDEYHNFMQGFNEKYLDDKYEDNPYVFLITIQGKK